MKTTFHSRFPALVTIDPGLYSMGWSVWNFDRMAKREPFVAAGLIRLPNAFRKLEMEERAAIMADRLDEQVFGELYQPEALAVEYPAIFGTMGMKSAKDAMTLMFFVGQIARTGSVRGMSVQTVPVRDWKGQLPKNLVQKRIERIFDKMEQGSKLDLVRADAWDAVGIGVHLKSIEGAWAW